MNKLFIFFINFYQKYFSRFICANCRYVPTCSEYSKLCFEKYGFLKAFFKTFCRILRCNPFSKGGLDLPLVLFFLLSNVDYYYTEIDYPAAKKIMYISVSKINLRYGPGKEHGIKAVFNTNGHPPVQTLYSINGWTKIKTFSGDIGWVMSSKLRMSKLKVLAILQESKIYNSPYINSKIVAVIGKNQLVIKEGVNGDFIKISLTFNNRKISGWIEKKYVWGDI